MREAGPRKWFLPDIRPHVDGHPAEHVDHVNLRRLTVFVATENPGLGTVVIVNIENSEVPRAQSLAVCEVPACLRDPASTPVIPG